MKTNIQYTIMTIEKFFGPADRYTPASKLIRKMLNREDFYLRVKSTGKQKETVYGWGEDEAEQIADATSKRLNHFCNTVDIDKTGLVKATIWIMRAPNGRVVAVCNQTLDRRKSPEARQIQIKCPKRLYLHTME